MSEGYHEAEWAGLPQLVCDYCTFGVVTKDGDVDSLRPKMDAHIRKYHRGAPPPFADADADVETADSAETVHLGDIDFASDAGAEAFNDLEEDVRDAVAVRLLATEQSGKTGYTKADVESAAEAVTNEEE